MIKLEYFDNVDTWIRVTGVLQDSLSDEITLDESYDNATIKARNTENAFNEPFTKYRVFDGNEYQYYIGTETVKRVQMSKYYMHEYRLTEPTKIIERYKLSGLSVTQNPSNKKSLLTVINRALKDVNTRYNKNFELSDDERLKSVLTQECPEFAVTKKTTLFEFLYNYIGKFINAMPRVLGDVKGNYNEIDFDFFEDLTKVDIEINETALEYSKSEDNASTYIETEVSNLVVENADNEGSIVYPYPNGWITPRSDNIRLTNDNATMVLPYDIKSIVKIEIQVPQINIVARVNNGYQTKEAKIKSYIPADLDITNFIITEYEWLSLSEKNTEWLSFYDKYKNNTLYYSVGSNTIENLSKTYKGSIFGDYYSISYLIASALYKYYKDNNDQVTIENDSASSNDFIGTLQAIGVLSNFNPKDLKYRITYIPYIDTVTAQINPYGIEKGSLTYNQSAETVNAQTLGESMWLELQNQNTTTYQKTARYDNISDILKVGDIIDNKIITNVLRAFTGSKWINVLYKSNEDFIRKSQYIQENREYRPYSIPATTIVDRHIHTDDYCYIGYSNKSNGSSFRTDFIESFIEKKKEINNALIKTGYKLGNTSQSIQNFLTVSSIALGHSIQFDWSFVDNYSAGKYLVDAGSSTPTISDSSYSEDGEFKDFTVVLNPSFKDNELPDANYLPKPYRSNGTLIEIDSSYYTAYYNLDKDAGEKIGGSIQLHFLPNENDIIVTSNLAKDCPLISSKNYNFRLAFTNENLNKYSSKLNQADEIIDITKSLNIKQDEYGDDKIAVKFSFNSEKQNEYKYWVLINDSNDIYCAGLCEKLIDGIYLSFVGFASTLNEFAKLIYSLIDESYYVVTGVDLNTSLGTSIKIPLYRLYNENQLPIKEISANAFENQPITSLDISNNVEKIGNTACQNCRNLTTVTIGENVKDIGITVFKNCSSLKEVYFNAIECNQHLGNNSFSNAGNETEEFNITFGSKVKKVVQGIFTENKNITSVDLSSTTDCEIGVYSFDGCSKLKRLILSNSIKSIGLNAFNGAPLSIYTESNPLLIPNSVTKLGQFCFGNLQYAQYNSTIKDWNTITGSIYGNVLRNGATLFIKETQGWNNVSNMNANETDLLIPNVSSDQTIGDRAYESLKTQNLERVVISEGITSIGEYAFSNCVNLKEIIIPYSVKTIGSQAFYNCSKLEKIYFAGNLADWNNLSGYTGSGNNIGLPSSATIKTFANTYTYKLI